MAETQTAPCPRCNAGAGQPCIEDDLLTAGHAAVMEQMGWTDDRDEPTEYAGSAWDTATDVATAVLHIAGDFYEEQLAGARAHIDELKAQLRRLTATPELRRTGHGGQS